MKLTLSMVAVAMAALGLVVQGCGSTCGPSNCSGCCDASNACQLGGADSACGKGGVACATCAGGQQCVLNACAFPGGGAGGNSGGTNTSSTSSSSSSSTSTTTSSSTTSSGTSSATTSSSTTTSSTGTSSTTTSSTTTSSTTTSGTTTSGTTTSGTTSSTTTSSTTTSSGTTTGSTTGTSDADCGTNHAVCSGDDHCYNYYSQGSIYACGCNVTYDVSGNAQDTCASNSDGNVVCDQGAGHCRPPRDYEKAGQTSGGYICDTGYTPVDFGNALQPNVLCIGTCQSTSDCRANFVYCLQNALNTSDGGAIGACLENDCGPDIQDYPTYADGGVQTYPDGGHLLWPDGGTETVPAPTGNYFASCDVSGASGSGSGGTCLPIPNTSTSYIGICFRDGAGQAGSPCTGFVGVMSDTLGNQSLTSCGAGLLCINDVLPYVPAGTTYQTSTLFADHCDVECNAADGGSPQISCPTVNGNPTTCSAIFNSEPVSNGLEWAVCQ